MDSENCLSGIIKEIIAVSCKKKPCIVGIGGGAGVGKTALADVLKNALEQHGKKVLVVHLDDFFKSFEERQRIKTEWDENHINLALARRVLGGIKHKDAKIIKPKYNRATRKIESQVIDSSGIDVAIFEGIYAISSKARLGNFIKFVDLPIFMSAELSDIKQWRFLQEEKKPRPRSTEQMERHWNFGILPDLEKNIIPSEKNAKFVIHADSNHNFTITRLCI